MWRRLFVRCLGGPLPPTPPSDERGRRRDRDREPRLDREEEERREREREAAYQKSQYEVYRLHEKIHDLSTQLDLERTENERELGMERASLETRSRQMAEQMRTCLARIDELERVNHVLREDAGIAARREKSFAGQLAMVREELERREEEKAALISSLETALATIYKLKKTKTVSTFCYS